MVLKFHAKEGSLNTLINTLPFEFYLPSYQFCGPGTKLKKRIEAGDQGINPLDEACKKHDISYSQFSDVKHRNKADKVLENRAWERVKAKDSSFGEKSAAWFVTNIMKAKRKLGMGMKKKRKNTKLISFQTAVNRAKKGIVGKKYKKINFAAKDALAFLKKGKIKNPKTRIIPIPKTGGFLPLIPLFAGLSALGALGGGAAGIAKAVTDVKAAQAKLDEDKRHNRAMEEIAVGKKGKGLFLKPYKTGYGLCLKEKNC